MIKEGMFVRCSIDMEYPENPRVFATGKVVSINDFNETAHIVFADPFGYRKYFDYIPDEIKEAPINSLYHCHLFKDSLVKVGKNEAVVVEYKGKNDDLLDYYLLDRITKEYKCVKENKITAAFLSGSASPVNQLRNYEFHNPCWYLGRHIVKNTMNILDNSIFGFKELAGCKIYLKAFQLNTIMQCLQGDNCRYMIADEVGLGKTIEACSVLKIFLSSKSNQRILIAVPRSLVAQWRTELLFKFGLIEEKNNNSNFISLLPVEDISDEVLKEHWDFLLVDEVHNYLKDQDVYNHIHTLSLNTDNIIVLSATPIQQRKEEYLRLLRIILPAKYDEVSIEQFTKLVEKQNAIARQTHLLLDEMDTFKTELLPEYESSENLHEEEDIQDELEEIDDTLSSLKELIDDMVLSKMIENVDTDSEDFGMYSIQVIVSYICDNYQIERNIIRGRRAVLGIYPKDPDGEFSERKLDEIVYSIDEETNFYENEAYQSLMSWIISIQDKLDEAYVLRVIKPLLESFFSSPWAYVKKLNDLSQSEIYPEKIINTANKWMENEDEAAENMADILDDVDEHPSRMAKIISYIDTNLFGKKVVLFTEYIETFSKYYSVLKNAYGDEVTGFSTSLNQDEAEMNIYRFQSDENCKILICDKSGGEGRNLQVADYIIHIDLPWSINTIEQRIGRLDRLGREIEIPVTSVVIHTIDSYEEQLFKFWNEGLNVFRQSLSGLEIIMNDINQKITNSIMSDFEYGLYRLVPELIEEAETMRETVHKEQIFDTAALRYKPLYIELEKLLSNYQFNENKLFADTMMSWASIAGFGQIQRNRNSNLMAFDEMNFSIKSAQNSFLVPPDWNGYLEKKQNEAAIRVQRGVQEEAQKNTTRDDRKIIGTFNRDAAIKNDYIHFYAPGDEIFDCIVNNAMHSYKGMCTAFAAESNIDWKGFIYTYSIEPNERLLLEKGVSLYALGLFRQYLAISMQVVPVSFSDYSDVPEKLVLSEHKRLCQIGYFHSADFIDHLGRRGHSSGFLDIPIKFHASNMEWFKNKYREENWKELVDKSYQISRNEAKIRFFKESNLTGAQAMIDQIMSANESRVKYFRLDDDHSLDDLREQYEIILESLSKPIIRLESACFMMLVKE